MQFGHSYYLIKVGTIEIFAPNMQLAVGPTLDLTASHITAVSGCLSHSPSQPARVHLCTMPLTTSQLHFCYDSFSGSCVPLHGADVAALLQELCTVDVPRHHAQHVVQKMAAAALLVALDMEPCLSNAIVVPVLCAGLPMTVPASEILPGSECIPVSCSKEKGTHGVTVRWLGEVSKDRPIVLLDTIVATGDSLLALCNHLQARDMHGSGITIVLCYGLPKGLAAVCAHPAVENAFAAALSVFVDAAGYVIPYTNGNVGDELCGRKEAT